MQVVRIKLRFIMQDDAAAVTVCPASKLVSACNDLSLAWGKPCCTGTFKFLEEDFLVDEQLGFTPDGSGEHLFVHIEKKGLTTAAVQKLLAQHFNCAYRDVAFSGMKDRQGITRQWFSIHLPGKQHSDALPEATGQMRVLHATRSSRKLKRGVHRANQFVIRIRDTSTDMQALQERLSGIRQHGVPNYFGPQRFGFQCGNLTQAQSWFSGELRVQQRNQRSMLLSAARAFLFNQLLSDRVTRGCWHTAIAGDVMALAGSGSVFNAAQAALEELQERLASQDIHPSGPLWGTGPLKSSAEAAQMEMNLARQYPLFCRGLEERGLKQERRALRLSVQDLSCQLVDNHLILQFTLERGCYATSVLRELVQTDIP